MTIRVLNRHKIILTHIDKVYFPSSGITKGELIDYYQAIAPILLPYCHNRPLTMDRFIEGIRGESFFQKNASPYFPAWIKRKSIPSKSKIAGHETTSYVVCQNVATLIYITNQGCITPHTWLSKTNHLDYPDMIIFDLDPAEKNVKDFKPIAQAALIIKDLVQAHGLSAGLMTTGSRGLHVRVPINPKNHFDDVRLFAKKIAQLVVEDDREKFTLESHKKKRGKRLLIDIMRNSFGATAVLPYAVRAREGAPVATPIDWDELHNSKLRSDTYTIKNIFDHLNDTPAFWQEMNRYAKQLPVE